MSIVKELDAKTKTVPSEQAPTKTTNSPPVVLLDLVPLHSESIVARIGNTNGKRTHAYDHEEAILGARMRLKPEIHGLVYVYSLR